MFFSLSQCRSLNILFFSSKKIWHSVCNDHELQSLIDNPFIMKQKRDRGMPTFFSCSISKPAQQGPVTFRHWKIQRLSISALPCEFPYHAYDILIIKFKSFLNPLRVLYALNKLFAFNNGSQIVNCELRYTVGFKKLCHSKMLQHTFLQLGFTCFVFRTIV